jgi:hypothetical protein
VALIGTSLLDDDAGYYALKAGECQYPGTLSAQHAAVILRIAW